jgi:hypothetical protein
VKKVLFWILPLFLVACSLFSYQIGKDYIFQLKGEIKPNSISNKSINNTSTNRPKIQTPLFTKTVIVINNGFDNNSFQSFMKNNLDKELNEGVFGIFQNEPINDPKQAIRLLLSGSSPAHSGIKNSNLSEKQDNLILVAKQNKKSTLLYSNLDYATDNQSKEGFNIILSNWKKYDLLVFDFNNQSNLMLWKNQYFEPILKNLSQTDLLFFCSLIPESSSRPFTKPSKYYLSPFFLYGKNLNLTRKAVSSNLENITATLAFSTGLSLPSDCLGYPELNYFTFSDKEKITRGYSSVKNFIINSIGLLYQYNINETIIAGYLMESIDSIDLNPAKTTGNLLQQYTNIKREFQSYTNETRQRSNLVFSLFFLFLSLFFLVIWLLLLVKYYRSFMFGAAFIIIFLVFEYFVFRIPVSFPKENFLSLRWFLFQSGVPLFLSAILVSISYTIFSGYVFDITFHRILEDLNGMAGTFGLFILGEITFVANTQGFRIHNTSSGYFFVTLVLRNFSLLILLSVTLLLMYGTSYITFKLLSKYGPKQSS